MVAYNEQNGGGIDENQHRIEAIPDEVIVPDAQEISMNVREEINFSLRELNDYNKCVSEGHSEKNRLSLDLSSPNIPFENYNKFFSFALQQALFILRSKIPGVN